MSDHRAGHLLLPWVMSLLASLPLGGCNTLSKYLHESPEGYLLQTYDVLTPPKEKVALRVRLQRGAFFSDQQGAPVEFRLNGRSFAQVITDDEGYAATGFIPPAEGDYVFDVNALDAKKHEPAGSAQLLVACRKSSQPMMIVDLDKTLVASGMGHVLIDRAQPMPGSAPALQRLSRRYTLVYVTHRPDFLGPLSKEWLRRNEYPRGVVLLSDIREFVRGSEKYKTLTIGGLRRQFNNLQAGVGDQPSDIRVYHENGMQPFLIFRLPDQGQPEEYRKLARSFMGLPHESQVVTAWEQIEQVLDGRGTYSRDTAIEMLRRMASMAETRAAD